MVQAPRAKARTIESAFLCPSAENAGVEVLVASFLFVDIRHGQLFESRCLSLRCLSLSRLENPFDMSVGVVIQLVGCERAQKAARGKKNETEGRSPYLSI